MANYRKIAARAARRHGLDPGVFQRQIQQESGFNANARSPAGATGIAQIMPATARSWGVNPNNPRQALDAAAKNMATYVKQLGSYDKALRAYNAGPGNVERSRGFSETNNYVRTILGGHEPKPSSGASRHGGGDNRRGRRAASRVLKGPAATSTTTTVTPGVDRSRDRAELLSAFLGDKSSDIVSFALNMRNLKDTPEQRSSTSKTTPGQSFRVPGSTRGAKPRADSGRGGRGGLVHGHRLKIRGPVGNPSGINEMFWQGAGGINVKHGQRVPQGFVSGHQDHVHVAANTPAEIVRIGKMAQRMGLHVGEQPHFGTVHRVHVANSNHYKNLAIDVSGDAAKMRQFAHTVARHYGVT